MCEEDLKILLGLLKIALHRADPALDEYLNTLLRGAFAMITRKGATLDLKQYDHQAIVVGHAEWQYRARDNDVPMPPWLRQAIHDLIIDQKAVT